MSDPTLSEAGPDQHLLSEIETGSLVSVIGWLSVER